MEKLSIFPQKSHAKLFPPSANLSSRNTKNFSILKSTINIISKKYLLELFSSTERITKQVRKSETDANIKSARCVAIKYPRTAHRRTINQFNTLFSCFMQKDLDLSSRFFSCESDARCMFFHSALTSTLLVSECSMQENLHSFPDWKTKRGEVAMETSECKVSW